jgi:lysosomal acid lipase/cholesteryl ester hydrolase
MIHLEKATSTMMQAVSDPFNSTTSGGGRRLVGAGTPVLLLTNYNQNADDWFKYIPKSNNLPYWLVEHGFDVWVGNNRGVYDYSSNISYRANQVDIYWNFDFTDMADHDLPTQIDYVLEQTRESKLTFIGLGRGNT